MSLLNLLFGSKPVEGVSILDRNSFANAIAKGKVQLVDVRTKREYNAGHIKGAINIDFFDRLNFNQNFEKLDKNKPVYIYCQSGNRSQNAAKKLVKMGFTNVLDLRGGFMAW